MVEAKEPSSSAQDRQRFIEYVQSDPMVAAQLRAPLYEDKVVDFLFDKAEVTEKTVTKDELQAAIEAEESTAPAATPAKKAAAKKAPAKKAEAAPVEEEAPAAEAAPKKKAAPKKEAAPKPVPSDAEGAEKVEAAPKKKATAKKA